MQYVYTKICLQIFLVILFIIAENWKQPNHHQKENGLKKSCRLLVEGNTTQQLILWYI